MKFQYRMLKGNFIYINLILKFQLLIYLFIKLYNKFYLIYENYRFLNKY